MAKTKSAEQKKRELKEKQRVSDLRAVLKTPQGRRVVWNLLSQANVFQSPSKRSNFKTNETFFEDGKRYNGLKLHGDVTQNAPDEYLLMVKENAGD